MDQSETTLKNDGCVHQQKDSIDTKADNDFRMTVEPKGCSAQQKTNNDCDLSVHFSSPVIEEEHTISQYSLDNTEPMEDTEPYDNILIDVNDKPKLQRVDAVVIGNLRSVDNEATFAIVFDLLSGLLDDVTACPIPDVTGTTVYTKSCDIVNGIIDSVLDNITAGECSIEKPTNQHFDMAGISNFDISNKVEQKCPMNKMTKVTGERREVVCESLEVTDDSVKGERSKVTAKIPKTQVDMSTEEVVKSPEVEMCDDVNEISDSNESTEMFADILSRVNNVLTDILKKIDKTPMITMTDKIVNSSQGSSHTLGSLESDDKIENDGKMADSEKVKVNENISANGENPENISTHDRTKYSSAAINFFKMADMSLAHQSLERPHDQDKDKIEQQIQEDMSEPTQEEESIREDDHQLDAVKTASKFLEDITDKVANTVQHNREDELFPKLAKAVVQSIQLELSQVKTISQPDCDQNGVQIQEPSIGKNDFEKVILFLENVTSRVEDLINEKYLKNLLFHKTRNNLKEVKLNEDDKIESVANVENEVQNMIITEKDQEENNTTANVEIILETEKDEHENITIIASEKDQEKALALANNEEEIDRNVKVSEKNQEETISTPNNKDKVENIIASDKDKGEAITAAKDEKEVEGTIATKKYQEENFNEVANLVATKKHQEKVMTTINENEVKTMISIEKEKKTSENEEKKVEEMIASARNYMETTVAQYENNTQRGDIGTTSPMNHQMDGPYTRVEEPNSISQSADSDIPNHKGVKRKLDFPRNCVVCPMLIELPKDHSIKDMSQEKSFPIIDSVSISQTIRAMLITLISEDVPYNMDPTETCLENLTADYPDSPQIEENDGQDNIESEHEKFILCRDNENDRSAIYQTEQELNPTDSNSDFISRANDEANTGSPYHILVNDEGISYSPIIGSLSSSSSSSSDVPDPGTDINDSNVPCELGSITDDEGVKTAVQFQTASQVLSERLSQESIDENPSANDTNNNKHSEQSKGNEIVHEMNLKRKTTCDEVIPTKVRAIEDDYSTLTELTEMRPQDQQVPGFVDIVQSQDDTTVDQHTLLQNDISFNHEESFYGELNGEKVYACDADMVDDIGGSQCQTVDEHDSQGSIEEAADVDQVKSVASAFHWRHPPSSTTDRVVPGSSSAPESLNNVTPLKTCPRPLRLGLSRNSRPRSLHKNFQIPFKR